MQGVLCGLPNCCSKWVPIVGCVYLGALEQDPAFLVKSCPYTDSKAHVSAGEEEQAPTFEGDALLAYCPHASLFVVASTSMALQSRMLLRMLLCCTTPLESLFLKALVSLQSDQHEELA